MMEGAHVIPDALTWTPVIKLVMADAKLENLFGAWMALGITTMLNLLRNWLSSPSSFCSSGLVNLACPTPQISLPSRVIPSNFYERDMIGTKCWMLLLIKQDNRGIWMDADISRVSMADT